MWREGRVGPGCEFRSSSMRPEPILAPLIKGRRPKHVCHYPSLGRIRYKKLEKVTDVRYGPPLFCSGCYTISEDDSGGRVSCGSCGRV